MNKNKENPSDFHEQKTEEEEYKTKLHSCCYSQHGI